MRLLLFAGLGLVLGYLYFSWVRHATRSLSSHRRAPRGRDVVGMVFRVVAFSVVLGLLLFRYGPLAGIAVLVGVVLARGLMARSEPRLGGQ